jgi:hypothetical protein
MRTLGSFRVELVYARPDGSKVAHGVVPEAAMPGLEAELQRHKLAEKLTTATDPATGLPRPAFRPVEGRRLAWFEERGIAHGDRFLASFDVRQLMRGGRTRREAWLVEAVKRSR